MKWGVKNKKNEKKKKRTRHPVSEIVRYSRMKTRVV